MKGTENFKKIIQQHLNRAASMNSLFAKRLEDPDKNIDDCITYILKQVKESGSNGFEDSEIYGMAMHYYDEKDLKVGKPISGKVVVNQQIKLTEEEIEEARKQAKQKVLEEEMAKLRKKPAKKVEPKKDDDKPTLF
jgi:predicted nucleic acid-binding protein